MDNIFPLIHPARTASKAGGMLPASLHLFCRLGAYVYSKPVDLVYRGDGFCLVRSAQGAADERILRQGDLVISTARALTDGMIFPDN